jgi:hypothetical protein
MGVIHRTAVRKIEHECDGIDRSKNESAYSGAKIKQQCEKSHTHTRSNNLRIEHVDHSVMQQTIC